MEKFLILIFCLFFLTNCSNNSKYLTDNKSVNQSTGLADPAGCYSYMLGYPESMITDSTGGQSGLVTLPDNEKVNEWDFYDGYVGQNYSYCAIKGFHTMVDTIYDKFGNLDVCTACIKLDSLNNIIAKYTLDSLMNIYGDSLCKPIHNPQPRRKG